MGWVIQVGWVIDFSEVNDPSTPLTKTEETKLKQKGKAETTKVEVDNPSRHKEATDTEGIELR